MRSTLPSLSAVEAAHSERVVDRVRVAIEAAGGSLSFGDFMEIALYAPGLGYYSAGARKLGEGGDFTTAPEMSDLFGRCVARQVREILRETGGDVLEFGAGSGALAADVLRTLADENALPANYFILDVSADLRERQAQRLRALPADVRDRVRWIDELPTQFTGVMLANEVLDALPCERFAIRDAGIRALHVAAADQAIVPTDAVPSAALRESVVAIEACLGSPLDVGYVSEVNLRVHPWIAALAASLTRGAILAFDYGLPRSQLYHAERSSGTLRCHFRQLAHDDPFIHVGLQDITAWVDFTAVAEAAVDAGLDVRGFTTQAGFLLGLGIEADVASAEGDRERVRRAGEARRLLLPGEMGEVFKAIALTRDVDTPLSGFILQDLRRQL